MLTLLLSPLERMAVLRHEEIRQLAHRHTASKWQKQKLPNMVANASNSSICGSKAEDPCEFEVSLDDTACSRPGGASQLDLSLREEVTAAVAGGKMTLKVKDRADTLGLHHPDLSHQHSDLECNRRRKVTDTRGCKRQTRGLLRSAKNILEKDLGYQELL